MACTKKSVILTLGVLALSIGLSDSAISSVVLYSQAVTAGQDTTFSCMSSGTGPDPTITWALRYSNGTTINANLFTTITGGTDDNNDGTLTSSVTFFVQNSYLPADPTDSSAVSTRLYCFGEDDQGAVRTIYTTLRQATTTTANLGQTCSSSTTCSTVNSYCNTALSPAVCECNSNYYDSNGVSIDGSCIQKAGLSQSCQAGNDESCSVLYSVCSTNSPFVCVCGSTYTQSGSQCVPNAASYGQSCTNPTRSCLNSATCISGTCQCGTGLVYSTSQGECISNTASYGQSCTNPTRSCLNSATCISGICQCGTGFVYSSSLGGCISNTASYGNACTNPTRTCLNSATCISGTCQCGTGLVYSTSQGECISNTATYGQSCTNPTRNCLNSATCISGTCQCGTGLVYSTSQASCISDSANLGSSCTNPTRQCPSNAECTNNVCQCSSGYVTSGNTCIIPGLGQGCSATVGCQTTTSGSTTITLQCVNSVCSCPSNYYLSNGACILKHALGQSCTSSVSTSCADSAAYCPTGVANPTCQCNSGYTATFGVCVQETGSECPAGSNTASIVTGISSPSVSTTPSVWVEQTCYTVNLLDTQVMRCKDTKAGNLRDARWIKLPNSVVVASTGSFINGDKTNPNLTVSSAQASYAGFYICQLCYADNFGRCTNSSAVQLIVSGTAITSSTVSISPSSSPTKGSQVTMSCGTTPVGAATSYTWFKSGAPINGQTSSTFVMPFVQASHSGEYTCRATNDYGSLDSSVVTLNVQYAPEFRLTGGGSTEVMIHDFDTGDLTLTCDMTGNPAITQYLFYDQSNTMLADSASSTYTVTSSQGYQTYSCRATNAIGISNTLSFEVQEPGDAGNVGAATENTGIGTGTIAAIVLGIIFFLLLIIIIIVCCCNYGWCRKKEKVEPQPPPPAAKPYIPRTIVSANSTVTRKDIGVMVNGYRDEYIEYEEPRYTTPRYHLKPALNSGPIISMYDDGYEQPRAHQLPALDTQYLYTDEEPRKRHKKKRKRRHREHREASPRRHDYEPGEPVNLPPSDEDLVVVPGKQNYFE